MSKPGNNERLRRYWDKHARSYDRQMRLFDRTLFAASRTWVCSQADGDVLEVAIGTGLNLPLYPPAGRLNRTAPDLPDNRTGRSPRAAQLLLFTRQRPGLPISCSAQTVLCFGAPSVGGTGPAHAVR